MSLAALFGTGGSETHDPGGLPASLMLWIAGPALFVAIRQKVRDGANALPLGAVCGVAACLLFTWLLGMLVFDFFYRLLSNTPRRGRVPAE